jgi:hypothetical protein
LLTVSIGSSLALDSVRITQQVFAFGRTAANVALEAHRLVHRIANVTVGIGAAILFFTFNFLRLAEMLFVLGYHAAVAAFVKFRHHRSPFRRTGKVPSGRTPYSFPQAGQAGTKQEKQKEFHTDQIG